jgi:hypothetical protein
MDELDCCVICGFKPAEIETKPFSKVIRGIADRKICEGCRIVHQIPFCATIAALKSEIEHTRWIKEQERRRDTAARNFTSRPAFPTPPKDGQDKSGRPPRA